MDWYATIKRLHDRNLWTKKMVADAVYAQKITAEQYTTITGDLYEVPYVAPFIASIEQS